VRFTNVLTTTTTTVNGVTVLIVLYFAEFDKLRGRLRHSGWR